MLLLLDVKDEKADFVLELLNSFPYAKAKVITPAEANFLIEFKKSIEYVKLAEQGKVKPKTIDELLAEL